MVSSPKGHKSEHGQVLAHHNEGLPKPRMQFILIPNIISNEIWLR